ncbi:antA/AntB antirepressor family protein [Mailhella sp.]
MSLSLSVVSASIGNVQQLAVDARLLHQTLGAKRDFSNWIKGRIEKYAFKENEDFIIFAKSGEKSVRGRHSIEYTLSLDMAKELAMVENNERGRLVRRYFIECERRLQGQPRKKAPPRRKLAQVSLPGLSLDLTRTDPISLTELVDVLTSLEYRMERTCLTVSDADWKAGARRFFEAAGSNHVLTNMLSCTLVGPRFATLDLIKAAASMARKAQRMHQLLCECR